MRLAFAVLLAPSFLLGACQAGPTLEQVQAADADACSAAGFQSGSDAERLCLLLQETNRRLDGVERRLNFLEVDTRRSIGYGRCGLGSC